MSAQEEKLGAKPTRGAKVVVVRRRKHKSLKRPLSQRKGLPSYTTSRKIQSIQCQETEKEEPEHEFHEDPNNMKLLEEDLPSDTFLALQALRGTGRGLQVPLQSSSDHVPLFLQTQLYRTFEDHHASSVLRDIHELVSTNRIRRIPCPGDGEMRGNDNTFMLVFRADYERVVWDALEYYCTVESSNRNVGHPTAASVGDAIEFDRQEAEEIISWFLENLAKWTSSTLSSRDLSIEWSCSKSERKHCRQDLSAEVVVQFLLRRQVLLRAAKAHGSTDEHYTLWMPKWGLVLQRWNEAQRKLLGHLARARGELSEKNLLSMNRSPMISTAFLLDDLYAKGKIKYVDRPFGRFVQKL